MYLIHRQPFHQLIDPYAVPGRIHEPLHCLVQGGQPRLYEKSSAERGAHPPLTDEQNNLLPDDEAAQHVCRSSLLR